MTCRYARSAPPAWREAFMQRFERLSLVIVLGSYAMDYHLGTGKTPLTRVVEAWREHWPQAFPLPHPSPRNNRWLVRNPWFQQDVLPALQARVQAVLTANPKETPTGGFKRIFSPRNLAGPKYFSRCFFSILGFGLLRFA